MAEAYYAVDTNYLLDNPTVVYEDKVVILPSINRELQKLERLGNNRYRAREVNRQLIEAPDEVYYHITDKETRDYMMEGYDPSYTDNRFIAEVLYFKDQHPKDEVVVVTGDKGMTNILHQLGIKAQPYKGVPLITESNRGIHNLFYGNGQSQTQEAHLATEIIQRNYEGNTDPFNPLDMPINEYLILWDTNKPTRKVDYRTGENVISGYTAEGVYKYNGVYLEKVDYSPAIKNKYNEIKPVNDRQRAAFDLVADDTSHIKLLTGVAGSGKTFILVNYALQELEQGKYKQIIWIRNPIDLEDTKDIGALPGDKDEKLMQYAMPVADILGGTEALYQLLYERDENTNEPAMVIENLNAIRGRSFKDSAIIVTETQNLTPNQVKVLVSRVGEGSDLFMDGDVNQGDTTKFKGYNGIRSLQKNLRHEPLFGQVTLDLVERSNVAKLAELL